MFVARPESEPSTELGKRLRLLRKAVGAEDLKSFADAIGVSKTALFAYEKGERDPSARALSAYRDLYGADINWILTGAGEMFADPATVPSDPGFHTIKPEVFRVVGRLVTSLHKAKGISLPPDALFDEQSSAYNALIEKAEDPSDADELLSLLPWLKVSLERKLSSAKNHPGTGKREA